MLTSGYLENIAQMSQKIFPTFYQICKIDKLLTKIFLDASTHLYKRVCPSVGPSVNEPIMGENGRK